MSINRVNISGNLTRDPELRSTPGGTQVLTFGVAVNDRRRNSQTGEFLVRALRLFRGSSQRVQKLPLRASFAIAPGSAMDKNAAR